MENELKCPICSEPTNVYMGNARKDRLCRKHGKLANENKIEQCKNCGEWKETGKDCKCEKQEKEECKFESELACIICGKPSNGKHFCYECYRRYKEKVILLKVHKCEFPTGEPLDESYEGVYECEDGHIVKSIAEQTIDNWLSREGIFHAYESPVDIGEEKPLKPDFCLKNFLGQGKDVYLEYFGLKGNPKYDEATVYKMKHYKNKKMTMVCLYPNTDGKNLPFALQTKLKNRKIKENTINYYEE